MTSFVLLVAVCKANFHNSLAFAFLVLCLFKQTFERT